MSATDSALDAAREGDWRALQMWLRREHPELAFGYFAVDERLDVDARLDAQHQLAEAWVAYRRARAAADVALEALVEHARLAKSQGATGAQLAELFGVSSRTTVYAWLDQEKEQDARPHPQG